MTMAHVRYQSVFVLSWVMLFVERFWAAYWPVVSVLLAFIGLACVKFFTVLGNEVHIALLFGFTAGFYIALFRFGTPFHMPTAKEVRRAIERESELSHRPLEALEDRPVTGSPKDAVMLWQKYQERLKTLWARTKVPLPRPAVGRSDPYSLRFAAILLLLIGAGVAQHEAPFRIKQALNPSIAPYFVIKSAALDVWFTPPAYTHLNPVFLATTQLGAAPATGNIIVPENSVLKVRIAGYDDAPKLEYGEKPFPFAQASARNFTLEMPVAESGRLLITRWLVRKLGDWPVTVLKDKPPGIVLLKAETTKKEQIKFTYTANDDYRVKDVAGSISPTPELAKRLGAASKQPIEFDIPQPETGDEEKVHVTDLTSHPWAGSEVLVTLLARDDADHTGESTPYKMTLPERVFNNPVAQRIIAQRKQLIWYNNMLTRPIVAQGLVEIGGHPENYKFDNMVFLGLTMAYKRLLLDGSQEAVDSIVPLLWDIAIRVEDGGLALAQRELSDALAKLSEKLRDKNATKEEIDELMRKVQEKTREYGKQLANDMKQRMQGKDPNKKISQELMDKIMKQVDMEKLMKEMEELTKGSEREQMEKMAEFMKRNVDRMDPKKMEQMEKRHQKTMEGLDELQKLIERQQQLMDKTNKMLPPKDRLEPKPAEEQKPPEEQKEGQKEQDKKEDSKDAKGDEKKDQQGQQGQQQGKEQQQQQGSQGKQGEQSQGQQQGSSGQQQNSQGQQQGSQGQQQGSQGQQQGSQGQQQGSQGQQQGSQGQQQGSQGQQQGSQGQQQGSQGQQQGSQGQQQGSQGQQQGSQGQQQGSQGQQQGSQGQQQGSDTQSLADQLKQLLGKGKDGQLRNGANGQPPSGKEGQTQQQQGGTPQQNTGGTPQQNAGGPPQPNADGQGYTSAEEKEKLRQQQAAGGKDGKEGQPQPDKESKDGQAAGSGDKKDEKQQAAGGEGKEGQPQSGAGKDGQPQQAAKEGEGGAPVRTPGEGATEQGGIRQKLGDIMRQLGEGLPKVPQNFGSADQEMKQAGKAFKQDNTKGSLPHQKEALDQLQEGMDDATKQLADQIGNSMINFGSQGEGGQDPGGNGNGYGDGYDPLGRGTEENGNGRPSTGYVKIPDEKERRRVQEIIEELRTRSNDFSRPKSEREYINRLLNQFE